jgi:type II secretory pathway component PulF
MLMNKKGLGVGDMHPIVLALVLVGITLGIGATVIAKFGETMTAGSVAENVTNKTLTALNDFSTWLSIIVIVIAAAIILGLVMTAFTRREG